MSMGFWIKPYVLFFLVLTFFLTSANANEYAAEVKRIDVILQKNDYVLAADLAYHLSPQSNEALQNGVPLFWKIKIKFQKQRDFWFDKTEFKHELRYRLQYHALIKMYRVRNENTGTVNNFSTLNAALDAMATIRDVSLIGVEKLLENSTYFVAIKVLFDEAQLPLPLQTQLIANPQWNLSSDWTEWKLKH